MQSFAKEVARGRSALPGRFLSRRCFTLCITVEVEIRIANQYKCQYCCSYKNYRGNGMEGKQKVSSRRFWADQKIASSSVEKMRFGAYYSTRNKLLLISRHIMTTCLKKCL